jgi:hypothetical protein
MIGHLDLILGDPRRRWLPTVSRLVLAILLVSLASCTGRPLPEGGSGPMQPSSPHPRDLAEQPSDEGRGGTELEVIGVDVGGDLLARLDETHRAMLEGGLPLIYAAVTGIDVRGGVLEIQLADVRAVWTPPTDETAELPAPGVLSLGRAPDALVSRLLASPSSGAYAVIDRKGAPLAVALETAGGRSLVSTGAREGPLFLADAALWLFEHRVDPMPTLDPCQPPTAAVSAPDPQAALLGYFKALGATPRSDIEARILDIDRQVDEILRNASPLPDPVTGEHVLPAANDISNQLRNGVPPADVVLRPAIPVGVVVPPGRSAQDAITFVEATTGTFLGAIELQPVMEVGPGGERANYLRVLYVAPPEKGTTVEVYERSLSEPDFLCRPGDGREPLMVIPYDDFAGSSRALIDVASGRYEELTNVP